MAILPSTSTCLDLTISVPGSSSSGGGRDLDIYRMPASGGGEEEWMMMTAATSMEDEEEMSGGGGGPPRKKLRLSKEQSRLLEESFRQNNTLNPKEKEELAVQLKLRPRQVEVWFQNRRARSKLKQTEMECEYLKRWFGSLTEQNRRLQREVEELRAMKVSPSTVVSPHSCEPLPALSTLSMCPRCERVTTTALDKQGPAITSAAATLSANKATKSPPAPTAFRRLLVSCSSGSA